MLSVSPSVVPDELSPAAMAMLDEGWSEYYAAVEMTDADFDAMAEEIRAGIEANRAWCDRFDADMRALAERVELDAQLAVA
jgi:hypothetical protein